MPVTLEIDSVESRKQQTHTQTDLEIKHRGNSKLNQNLFNVSNHFYTRYMVHNYSPLRHLNIITFNYK